MSTPSVSPHAGLNILVADNDVDTADSLALLLEWAGHRVRVSRDGAAALAEAERELPDAVILDLNLAAMSGCELAVALRRRENGRRPLLIAVTGLGREADRRRSADSGFDLHLTKPAPPEVLYTVLERLESVLSLPSQESATPEESRRACLV